MCLDVAVWAVVLYVIIGTLQAEALFSERSYSLAIAAGVMLYSLQLLIIFHRQPASTFKGE